MIDRQALYERRAASRHRELARHYQRLMQRYYRFLVPPGQDKKVVYSMLVCSKSVNTPD